MYRFALRIRFAWTQMINYSIITNWFDNLEERWIFLVKLAAIFITTLRALYIDPQLSTQVSWNLHLISWDLGVPMVLNVSHWHFYFFFGFSYDANGPMDVMSFGQTLHLHAPLQCFVVYSLMLYLNAHALESRHTHTHPPKKKKNPNLFQTYKKFTVMAGLLSLMCIVEMSVLVSRSVSYLPKWLFDTFAPLKC